MAHFPPIGSEIEDIRPYFHNSMSLDAYVDLLIRFMREYKMPYDQDYEWDLVYNDKFESGRIDAIAFPALREFVAEFALAIDSCLHISWVKNGYFYKLTWLGPANNVVKTMVGNVDFIRQALRALVPASTVYSAEGEKATHGF